MRPSILIVDDEEAIHYSFKSLMSMEGNEVVTANDYPDELWKIMKALNKAKAARIPGISRQTIYRKIKKYKISNSWV